MEAIVTAQEPDSVLLKMKRSLHLGRALRLVWSSGRGWNGASIVLQIAQGLLPLLAAFLISRVIDAVLNGAQETSVQAKDAAFHHIVILIALAGGVALLTSICDALSNWVAEGQSQAVTDHVNGMMHVKALEVDLEYYENSEYHDRMHRAQEEAPSRPGRIVRGLATLGQSLITIIAVAVILIRLHPAIILILLLAAVPGVLARIKFIGLMFRWQRERTPLERRTSYFNYLLTLAFYAKEVRLFGLGPLFMQRFRDLRAILRDERLRIAKRRAVSDVSTQFVAIAPIFGCLAFAAYKAVRGDITPGALTFYYVAFQRGQSSLQGVLNSLLGLYEDNLFLTNFYEFLDLKPRVSEPTNPVPIPRPMQSGFCFENVDFAYPMTPRQALKDVDLRIGPGEVIALVGENGSGKTTLIKLLCRLYDPAQGRVTLDGVDLRDFAADDFRKQISVVFQDYAHYDLTARENIWFGNVDLAPDDPRIEMAARDSGADTVIRSLKQGYETPLGKFLGDGEELSIGQWQKIALARAFVRDSQLIVLDEPTSALDPKAEAEVFESFRELIKGKSAVLISHRLSTVKMADRIYVMDDGRIVESGTHDELVQSGQTYARLFEIQAQYYR